MYETIASLLNPLILLFLLLISSGLVIFGFFKVNQKKRPVLNKKDLILKAVFDSTSDLYFLMNIDGTILEYRTKKTDDLYVPPEIFLGNKMQDVIPADLAIIFKQKVSEIQTNEDGVTSYEYQLNIAAQNRYFEARLIHIKAFEQIVAVIRDITSRKQSEENLVKSELKYRSIFQSTVVAIMVVDKTSKILEWNDGAVDIFGYSAEEAIGMPLLRIIPSIHHAAHKKGFTQAVAQEKLNTNKQGLEVNGLRKNGEEFPINLTLGSWKRDGEVYFSGVIFDITDRKVNEEKILHQAHFDSLTDLPNRFLALDRLAQKISEAKRNNKLVAVVFLDLDDFKKVNDSLGHETGDKLLIESAERLKSSIREEDTVARLGGDEFIILLTDLKSTSDALPIVETILSRFRNPFIIEGRELILTISIGLSIYPNDGDEPSTLLRNADSAMYYAKDLGRNTYSYFTQSMNSEVSRRLELEQQIHGALERNEFEVYYQPQLGISKRNIIGAEALLRWKNKALGNVSPEEFIPIAEHTSLIIPIGLFVLRQSLKACAEWHQLGESKIRIAVNLSPRQFRDPELVNLIKDALIDANLAAEYLELEITEGVLMSGHSYIDEALKQLSELGVTIAMDDFGTGYSSLSYIRNYPFNILKIDRSFINEITLDTADKQLVNAAIVMAHALNIKVVAEGIETEQQFEILNSLGCDIGQGFLLSRPITFSAMKDLLTPNNK